MTLTIRSRPSLTLVRFIIVSTADGGSSNETLYSHHSEVA